VANKSSQNWHIQTTFWLVATSPVAQIRAYDPCQELLEWTELTKGKDSTRREFLAAAATLGGAAASHHLAHADDHAHGQVPSDLVLRVKTLESLMVEKGLIKQTALDALIDTYQHKVGPRNGARVVARAWVDPAYKERLLASGTAAIGELGFFGNDGASIRVVENTAKVHNLVVCTLCSCYPWPVLGLPPVWYKSAQYRSRAMIDPRGLLREFGTQLPDDVDVYVWDSTAEQRYLVLPERPLGTEKFSEEELASLVTRDAMIGVTKILSPQTGGWWAHSRRRFQK
jgi:nitrile hydratase